MSTNRYGYLFSISLHCCLAILVMFKSASWSSADLNTLYEVSLISNEVKKFENKSNDFAPSIAKKSKIAKNTDEITEQKTAADTTVASDAEIDAPLRFDLSSGFSETTQQFAGSGARHELSRTIKTLLHTIQSKLIYPESAKEREIEGRVLVEICIKNQEIKKINLHKSSGYQILDQAALAGVSSVKNVHNIFQQLKNEIVLIVPVKFTLLN